MSFEEDGNEQGNEKRGRRESSKDFSWIRSIKMKLNEQVRVEGSLTVKKKIYAC